MKTTLKHKVVSYPENPIILKILVQKKTSIHKKTSYPGNPGSEKMRNSRHIPCSDWILHVTLTCRKVT